MTAPTSTADNWKAFFAFVDETGNTRGRWKVLARAPNAGGNAMWVCECLACGERRTWPGYRLRAKPPPCKCGRPVIP